jgi:biopolymer transport protein ExbB
MNLFAGLSSKLVVGGWWLVENAERGALLYQRPTTNHRLGIAGVLRPAILAGLLLASAVSVPMAQVKVNEQTDQIAALQIELEQARQNRDRILARRWEDKQRDTEAREKFNREYDEIKNRLEVKVQEADRFHAEIQNHLRDAEEAQARAEEERVRFLSLASALRDKARDLSGPLERAFPARVPERIDALNKVLASADVKRDAPGEILSDLMRFQKAELALSREISLERRGFIRAGKEPGEGPFLRLGTVTAAYKDETSGAAGLLLKNPADRTLAPFDWKETLPPADAAALAKAMTILEKESGGVVLVPMDVLLTQNLAKTYTRASDKGFFTTVFETLETGGVFMIPLGFVLLFTLVLSYRKIMFFRRARRGEARHGDAVNMVVRGDAAGLNALRAENPANPVFRALGEIMEHRDSRAEAEKAVREFFLREQPRFERGLSTVAAMAAAAPMLGLLGTISGLVSMFQVITELGVNDPKMLAGGIGEALITTEAGLVIAIPALLLHTWLTNRADDLTAESEYRVAATMNALWPRG